MARKKAIPLSVLQKRARDKEYRLRRKGMGEDELARISPRVSAQDIKLMTPGQKLSYRRKLEKFNARKNRIIVLESGEGVPYERIRAIKQGVREWNRRVGKELAKQEGKRGEYSGYYRGARRVAEGIGGSVGKIDEGNMPLPRTRRGVELRAGKIEALLSRSMRKRRTGLRKQAMLAMRAAGIDTRIVNAVGNMSDAGLDALMNFTNFWDLISAKYLGATSTARIAASDSYEDSISALVKQAHRIPSYSGKKRKGKRRK